jgi:hypothetical protein
VDVQPFNLPKQSRSHDDINLLLIFAIFCRRLLRPARCLLHPVIANQLIVSGLADFCAISRKEQQKCDGRRVDTANGVALINVNSAAELAAVFPSSKFAKH